MLTATGETGRPCELTAYESFWCDYLTSGYVD